MPATPQPLSGRVVRQPREGGGHAVTEAADPSPCPQHFQQTPMATADIRDGRIRVIVVEDNRAAAGSLRLLLDFFGYEVRVAYDGLDGVRLAEEWPPEFVLCDLRLPGLDGFGVALALRQHPATAGTHLIAITA